MSIIPVVEDDHDADDHVVDVDSADPLLRASR